MQEQGHGVRTAIVVAVIGALGLMAAAVLTPVVQNYLDDPDTPAGAVATSAPTRGASLPRGFRRASAPMTLRQSPWSDAPIVQEIPTGTQIGPGLDRVVDNDGNVWAKIAVLEGPTGWVREPLSVETIIDP